MNTLRLLIVDDEALIRNGIRQVVTDFDGVEVVGECGCGADAIQAIQSHQPDVVLLDIQLPDCTGFDIVREVGPQKMPAVVFVTAYDEFAIRAFEVNAVDYLLKPFDEGRLRDSIDRARQRLRGTSGGPRPQLEALLHARESTWPDRLVVRNGERFDFVPVESIDWIESANNYICIHAGAKRYLLGQTLTSIEERLNPERFLRVHRCHLVNVSRIVAVSTMLGGAYELELRGGDRVRTGRQYRHVIQRLVKA